MLGSRVRSLSYTVAGRPAAAPRQRARRSGPSDTRHSTRVDSTPLHSAKCPFDWSGLSFHCMQSLQSVHWPGLSLHPAPEARNARPHLPGAVDHDHDVSTSSAPQWAQRRSIRSLQTRSLARVRVQHHRPRLSPPTPSPDECTICAAVARHCPFSEQLPQPAQTTPSSPLRSSIQTSRASSHTHKRINQASARASTTGKRVIRRSSART